MKSPAFKLFFLSAVIVLLILFPEWLEAQCRMCAASAEANLRNGGTEGAGLNTGILYLLSMPYLIALTIGGLWWYKHKQAKDEEEDELIRDLLSET